jgi:hypothetical protein
MSTRRPLVLAFAFLASAAGCAKTERTMLVVEVDSNLAVPSELDKIDLAISADGSTRHTLYSLVDGYAIPLQVGIVEAGNGASSIEVAATGYVNGLSVVSEDAVVTFVEGKAMLLKLFLAAECRGDPCAANPDQTCFPGGVCRSKTFAPGDLTVFDPKLPNLHRDASPATAVDTGGETRVATEAGIDSAKPESAADIPSDQSAPNRDAAYVVGLDAGRDQLGPEASAGLPEASADFRQPTPDTALSTLDAPSEQPSPDRPFPDLAPPIPDVPILSDFYVAPDVIPPSPDVAPDLTVAQYGLTVSKSGAGTGSVTSLPGGIVCGGTCAASFAVDSVVTLTATADTGSIFMGWSGACTGGGTCSVTMSAAMSVIATFMKGTGVACGASTECAAGTCLDGVCCTQSSCPQCKNCGSDGTCSIVVSNAADTTGTTCTDADTCDAAGACSKNLGQTCVGGGECASGHCLDSVCAPPGTWTNRTPAPLPTSWPSTRAFPVMVFDASRGRMVLFGGYDLYTRPSDTWEWDGAAGTWTSLTPTQSPPWRQSAAAAYDAVGRKVVMFGGHANGELQDLWEWDGAAGTWTDRTPSPLPAAWPTARTEATMAYDVSRGKMVLFGGSGPPDGARQDVWELDSGTGTWTDRTPSSLPASWPVKRVEHAMVYDGNRGRVLLFGGSNQAPDTWEWNGAAGTWTNRTPAPLPTTGWPSARQQHWLAYDSARAKVVLFGGYYMGDLQDLWEWDGVAGTWTDRTVLPIPANWPSARHGHAFEYDTTQSKVVLFGGLNNSGYTKQDLWERSGAP